MYHAKVVGVNKPREEAYASFLGLFTPMYHAKVVTVATPVAITRFFLICWTCMPRITGLATFATADVVKREADPEAEADPQLLYGHGLPVLPYHHTAVEIKEHCVEHTAKHCVDKPVTEEVETKVPHCVLVHGADCMDKEYTVPKTTCA